MSLGAIARSTRWVPALGCLLIVGCLATQSPDPAARQAVEAYWEALQRGDWSAAYARLDPDVRASLSPAEFEREQTRRRKAKLYPVGLEVTGARWVGNDVMVRYLLLYPSPSGGKPQAGMPPRRVLVRKTGESWGLAVVHDLLDLGD